MNLRAVLTRRWISFSTFVSSSGACQQQTVEPRAIPHNPPKDLVVSARRDLSFYEANFELIDNSIDKWRSEGAKRNLKIDIDYDLELLTGTFFDNAGGMDESDVYKVFIPGETTNRDFSKNTIGSFGMGAKKGIFAINGWCQDRFMYSRPRFPQQARFQKSGN